jgi:internalin A
LGGNGRPNNRCETELGLNEHSISARFLALRAWPWRFPVLLCLRWRSGLKTGVQVLSNVGILMRQQIIAWAGATLGFLVMTATSLADEAAAIEAVKKFGGQVQMDNKKPGAPVTMVNLDNQFSRLNMKLKDPDLKALKQFKSLRSLNLCNTLITDEGLKELREIKTLEKLVLAGARVGDAGMKELKDLKELREMDLCATKVTDAGLKELKDLNKLKSLFLNNTKVSDAGMRELKNLSSLETLMLNSPLVTDAGLKELKSLDNLRSLVINGTGVTDAGLKEIKKFKSIKSVQLSGTKVTDAGVVDLKAALPKLIVGYTPTGK